MNRFQFEETLFDALYAPMRAAWEAMEADRNSNQVGDIDDIVHEDNSQFPLDC